MIDISSLPHFAPEGYSKTTIPLLGDQIAEILPDDESYVWLESHQAGKRFIFLGETWSIECYSDKTEITFSTQPKKVTLKEPMAYLDFFNLLEKDWLPLQPKDFKLPWALAYEAGWNTETRKKESINKKDSLPELWLACPKAIIIQDIKESHACLIQPKHLAEVNLAKKRSLNLNYSKNTTITVDQSKETYLNKIENVKKHIREGDSFQVNLSQGFQAHGKIDLPSWAHHSFQKQASSFGALVKTKNFSLMSLSPERLVACENEKLITRPIAGTLAVKDDESEQELNNFRNHPKELAEHNMLIDLERNDLGKVSIPGSVEVEEYLTIETLPHVHHLVSQVVGKKSPTCHFGDILFALFPGGTITGCPKLETMHIIDKLEDNSRSFYTGSLGYLGQSHFDSNILIRTAIVHKETTYMRFGGGLVWDSDPEKEYLETLAKARGLISSLLEGGAKFDPHHRSLRQFFS